MGIPINALKIPFRVLFPGKLRRARAAEIGMLQTHESRVPDVETNSESPVIPYTSGSPDSMSCMARITPSVMGSSTPSSSPRLIGATQIAEVRLPDFAHTGHPPHNGTAAGTPNPAETRRP